MNHLAHLVLAGPETGDRLGALLGDHLKGSSILERLPPDVARGVRLHRAIDRWSDTDPAVTGLVRDLQPPWRRYAPIMLDVLFDHVLARNWDRHGPAPLDEFADGVDAMLIRHDAMLPPRLRRFAAWARATRLWTRYGERAVIEEIFARLAARHGRPSPLADGIRLLDRYGDRIEQAFETLFPRLREKARAFRITCRISSGPG
ncbi:MAG: ACP phosphodiesterase [Wenzhouxiangellaceae bacterium]|nr:ACP phosphodiesterase [Wenzhouxiangellaceae bacterium]